VIALVMRGVDGTVIPAMIWVGYEEVMLQVLEARVRMRSAEREMSFRRENIC
jgi:hypothetical protein